MKKVCIDVDGVLLDMLNALRIYFDKKGKVFIPENCAKYDFSANIELDRKEILRAFEDATLYHYEKFFDKALDGLKLLQKYVETVCYTTVINEPDIYDVRYFLCCNIGLKGQPFTSIAKPVLKGIDALFEDNLEVIKKWCSISPSTKIFLIDQPYNQQTEENKSSLIWDKIIRCENFYDAVSKYLKDCLNVASFD